MKKISINLLKVGLLLILGLCVFGVTSEVNAQPSWIVWEMDEIIMEPVGGEYVLKLPKRDTGKRQAVYDIFFQEDGDLALKDDSNYVYVQPDGNMIVNKGSPKKGQYYDSVKITFKKEGTLTLCIHARGVDPNGTFDSAGYDSADRLLEYTIKVLPSNQRAVDSTQQETIYFYNRKSGDFDDFSNDRHTTFTDNHIFVNKLDENGKTMMKDGKYILEKHIDKEELKDNSQWKVEDIEDGTKTRFTCLPGAKRSDGKQWYYIYSDGLKKWIQLTVVDYELVFIHPQKGEVKLDSAGYINLDKDTTYTLRVRQNGGNPININYWDTKFVSPTTAKDNYTKESWIKDITKFGTTTASNNDLEVGNTGSKINKLYEADYSNSTFTTLDMEAEFEYRIDRRRIYKPTNNLSAILTSAKIRIGEGTKEPGNNGGNNGGDNGGNNNPPPANTTLTYKNGEILAVDDCMEYKNGTNNSKNDTWNLRDSATTKLIGEIGPGDIVQITGVPTTGDRVSVKVIKVEDGNINGDIPAKLNQEGYITFNNDARLGFSKTTPTTGEKDPPPIGETDLKLDGFMGIISRIIEMLMKFITEINWAETISVGTSIVGEIFSAITGS